VSFLLPTFLWTRKEKWVAQAAQQKAKQKRFK